MPSRYPQRVDFSPASRNRLTDYDLACGGGAFTGRCTPHAITTDGKTAIDPDAGPENTHSIARRSSAVS
jgi:hypothetical protein